MVMMKLNILKISLFLPCLQLQMRMILCMYLFMMTVLERALAMWKNLQYVLLLMLQP